MILSERRHTRRRTPWPVHLVRLLVAVEVLCASFALYFLSIFTVMGVGLSMANGDISVGLVIGMIALLGLLTAFVVISITAATRLRRDRERARTVLVRLQWTMVATLLLASPITDDWLGVGLAGAPEPVLVLLGCGVGALAALQLLRTPR